jgi:hypothetical protein
MIWYFIRFDNDGFMNEKIVSIISFGSVVIVISLDINVFSHRYSIFISLFYCHYMPNTVIIEMDKVYELI